jgi:uncharacterized NAD(P)/FAD-binding protein YdhS
MMPIASEHVLVVGGGFSGTLLAINLLRHNGPRATLVERRPDRMARGVAYSAAHPRHLLNVRAANMSALPDDPGHFVRWLGARPEGGGPASFVPRTTYGAYLRQLLEETRAKAPDRLTLVEDEVIALDEGSRAVSARLKGGAMLLADAAVLAVGNLPPHDPPGFDATRLPADLYCPDPWAADLAEGLSEADEVVLLGTGLTAIDAALLLDAAGFRGRILALSRRGLHPRRHLDGQKPVQGAAERPAGNLSAVTGTLRTRAEQAGWRAAVDELRPVTQMLWGSLSDTERARFLRHARPWWDVHRHRLAPEVADRIDALVADGRLRFAAGKLVEAEKADGRLRLCWRPRGEEHAVETVARRVVNCTGPQGDLTRSREPLLRHLLRTATIRPDALRLGLDVDGQARVRGVDGTPSDRLHAVGPMTRGGVWEIVAVPDIRHQAWDLARRLSNAQWVGGEGL